MRSPDPLKIGPSPLRTVEEMGFDPAPKAKSARSAPPNNNNSEKPSRMRRLMNPERVE